MLSGQQTASRTCKSKGGVARVMGAQIFKLRFFPSQKMAAVSRWLLLALGAAIASAVELQCMGEYVEINGECDLAANFGYPDEPLALSSEQKQHKKEKEKRKKGKPTKDTKMSVRGKVAREERGKVR